MEFFDCNVTYGAHPNAEVFRPAETATALRAELTRAGVARAVVNRSEQTGSMLAVNELLAQDIAGDESLYGVWGIVPSHTRELPPPEALLPRMKAQRIVGWRLCPGPARFLPVPFVLREWMEVATARRLPVFINTAHGMTLEQLARLLEVFPELTVVLTYQTDWPSDRLLRPFVATYPNVHLDLSYMPTDGGIESFVEAYGASRLLFGSAFPFCYFGANLLMVKHAAIAEEARAAIAGGNLRRVIEEVRW